MDFDSARPQASGFDHWLKAVGLPTHFPRLDAVDFPVDATGAPTPEFDDRFYFGQPHEELIEAAIQSLAQPALANVIPDGHGITTLARYVHRRSAAEASLRALIPVSIVLEDVISNEVLALVEEKYAIDPPVGPLAEQRYFRLLQLAASLPNDRKVRASVASEIFAPITISHLAEVISGAIQGAIVRSLVSEPWERIIGRSFYAELVGAPTSSAEDLEKSRRSLRAYLGDRDTVPELFTTLDTRLHEHWTVLMPELQRHANVRLSIQFDLSPSPVGRYHSDGHGEQVAAAYLKAIENVAAAMKIIEQDSVRALAGTRASWSGISYLNVAYFLSDAAWTAFESNVAVGIEKTEFPAYTLLDVFTIMAVHFPRKTAGKKDRRDDLATVLDSNTIPYESTKSLSRMMEDLSSWFESLQMIDVRFQLTRAWSGIWGTPRALEDLEKWRQRMDLQVARLETELVELRKKLP